jgi:2-polyprenyl-3-methyl-5-hydroxy-6-metoxy-1,4-benzoquinol methylase
MNRVIRDVRQRSTGSLRLAALAADAADVERRAVSSAGTSGEAIYEMIVRSLARRGIQGRRIVDVGCGQGLLYPYLRQQFDEYLGVDVVRYPSLPETVRFLPLDLDSGVAPEINADVVVAAETIEHLENPRAFMRLLKKMARSGGWLVITTPNQHTLLSLATLALKHRFSAFQDVHYPAHLTALLEIDLLRIAAECGLEDVCLEYSLSGRVVGTAKHYPGWLARRFPRRLSDNLVLIGRKESKY